MFKKITFPNGLRLILAPMANSPSATVLVLVGTGSKYETKNINGISHFLEHLFFKGTKKRPTTLEIASELDAVGGAYNAFTTKEYTGYWAKVDAKHLGLALDWVADIFLNSKLSAEEIEREKNVIVEEINMYLDTPMQHVWHLWEQLLYGNQPAGWLTLGDKKIIQDLKRPQFLEYLKSQYVAKNTIVILAGNLSQVASPQAVVKKYFQQIGTKNFQDKLKVIEEQKEPKAFIHFKETDQTHLILGVRGYNVFHQDKYGLTVLAQILGGYMSSRLWMEIRERRALAYYVRAMSEFYTDSGYLAANAGLDNKQVREGVKIILREFKTLKEKKVSEPELKKAKDHIIGSTFLNLESSEEIAGWLAGQEVVTKKILTPEQFFAKIQKVSAGDIQRVAKDIFQPTKLNLALIGPFKEKEEFEKLLNFDL